MHMIVWLVKNPAQARMRPVKQANVHAVHDQRFESCQQVKKTAGQLALTYFVSWAIFVMVSFSSRAFLSIAI